MSQATELFYLTELSPRDKPLEKRKVQADRFSALYLGTSYHKYGERIADCSRRLVFKVSIQDNGKMRLKLKRARFCRVPRCPQCQGRRALKWNAKTQQIMPRVLEVYPKARFVMLTLTVPNCELTDLRSQLDEMNKAWIRLFARKELKVLGWIRTTEVVRRAKDLAGPHYHALLMVPPVYFGANYITQERWGELWSKSLKTKEFRDVDVRAVKPKKGGLKVSESQMVISAAIEVIKYAVKPDDCLINDSNLQKPGQRVRMSNQEWLLGLTEQLHKSRLIATGGVLKEYFKELEDERRERLANYVQIRDEFLAQCEEDNPELEFEHRPKVKRYVTESLPDITRELV